jgi:hypothetical protein
MSEPDAATARTWSKTLFNDVHFLRVATAIGQGPAETDATVLQADLKLTQPAVRRVIVDLEAVRLLDRLDRSTRTEPQRYRRAEGHPFWAAAIALSTASSEAER